MEQARVLNSDYGLTGKSPQQFALLLSQRARLAAHNADRSDRCITTQHWDYGDSMIAAGEKIACPGNQLDWCLVRICEVQFARIHHGRRSDVFAREWQWVARTELLTIVGIGSGDCRELHLITVGQRDYNDRIGEQPEAAAHNRVESRLRIGGRVADDFEDL